MAISMAVADVFVYGNWTTNQVVALQRLSRAQTLSSHMEKSVMKHVFSILVPVERLLRDMMLTE